MRLRGGCWCVWRGECGKVLIYAYLSMAVKSCCDVARTVCFLVLVLVMNFNVYVWEVSCIIVMNRGG